MTEVQKVVLLIENSRESGREFLRGVAKYARLHRSWTFYCEPPFYYRTVTYKSYRWAGIRKRALSELKAWGATGIIARDSVKMDEVIAMGLPTIFFRATTTVLRQGFPYVITDSEAIGRLGAEHFLERGFRNFAYLGFNDLPWSIERAKSFGKRIAEAGFQTHFYEESRSRSRPSYKKEQKMIEKWLGRLAKPVGIMVCNDNRAHDVIEVCKIMGVHVPEEIAILGVDDDKLECELLEPSLSSVALNCERGGYEAAELLDKMMRGEKVGRQFVLIKPTHVVSRQSTDIEAVEDEDVALALRYIRQHARTPIGVQDVADSVALTVRTLQKKFRLVLDRTVHHQIQIARIKQAQQMLVETNLNISEIALSLGYSGAEKLSRTFRSRTGIGPREYRRRYGEPPTHL